MHSMVRRHEVRLLRKAGKTQKETRELTRVPERSVHRIEREVPTDTFDDEAERKKRRVGRPSTGAAQANDDPGWWMCVRCAEIPRQ